MKTLFAFGLCIVSATLAVAQSHGLSHPLGILNPVPTAGALGGTYIAPVVSRPLGGVALPTFGNSKKRSPARTTVGGYIGPVYYTPNAFDSSYFDTSAYSGLAPSNTSYGVQSSGQPVVINQYFVTKGSSVPDFMPNEDQAAATAPVNPGDPLTPPASYYLIAYKDRSIYSALAYWIEGDTLHYVTTQNTHNQATLSLIDVDQTYKLNTDRSVPFSIPTSK